MHTTLYIYLLWTLNLYVYRSSKLSHRHYQHYMYAWTRPMWYRIKGCGEDYDGFTWSTLVKLFPSTGSSPAPYCSTNYSGNGKSHDHAITPNKLIVSSFHIGLADNDCIYYMMGLPVTAVFCSLVGGLLTTLAFYVRNRRRRTKFSPELAETGPLYDIPHSSTRSNPEVELNENVCYGKESNQHHHGL